jgi:hypothetical protein
MKFQPLICAGILGMAALSSAQAETWLFSYTAPGITASGSFVTAGAALVPEDILSITGLRNGVAITGLVPVGSDPNFSYDNQFTIGSPNFTDGGMLFGLAGGGFNTNVYFFQGTYSEVFVAGLNAVETPISWSVTAVPEPATVLTMLAGLGLMGVYMRKRAA